MNRENILQTFLSDEKAREILQLLEVIQHLMITYRNKFSNTTFMEGLRKINADLVDLISLLETSHLLEPKELSKFIYDFKEKLAEKESDFSLISSNETIVEPVKQYLENNFEKLSFEFEKPKSDEVMMMIKGNGYIVKRSLDNDIDKMLA